MPVKYEGFNGLQIRQIFLIRATFESDFLKGEEFHAAFGWLVEHASTYFTGKRTIGCCLVLPLSSMAGVFEAFTVSPRKSERIDAEVDDHRQSHTLWFGKCL